MEAKNETTKDSTTFEEHLNKRYGEVGSLKRTEFEIKAKAFAVGEVMRNERHSAKITQQQLAEKTGTKKKLYFSYRKWPQRHSAIHTIPLV